MKEYQTPVFFQNKDFCSEHQAPNKAQIRHVYMLGQKPICGHQFPVMKHSIQSRLRTSRNYDVMIKIVYVGSTGLHFDTGLQNSSCVIAGLCPRWIIRAAAEDPHH